MKTRDMSEKEFQAALERHGFMQTPLGLWFEDTTGVTPTFIGAIYDTGTGRIYRRETLAHLINYRDGERKIKAQRRAEYAKEHAT